MNKLQFQQLGYLDIIFENRNKDYGAYELRFHYADRLKKSMAGMFLIAGAIIICASLDLSKTVQEGGIQSDVLRPRTLNPTVIKVEQTQHRVSGPKVNTPDKPTEIAPDDKINNKLPDDKNIVSIPGPGTSNGAGGISAGAGVSSDTGTFSPLLANAGKQNTTTTIIQNEIIEEDIDPSFPGGLEALRTFLNNKLQFPDGLEESGVSIVEFVVQVDGKVTDIKVIKKFTAECDKEAIRIAKTMPNWLPGKYRGKAIPSKYTLPVQFVYGEQ
jgi:periplasmic protein TonB